MAMHVRFVGQLLFGRHLTTGDRSVCHPNPMHQAAGLLAERSAGRPGLCVKGLARSLARGGHFWFLCFDLLRLPL